MGEEVKESKMIEDVRSAVFKHSESLEGSCAKIQGYDFNDGINYTQILKSLLSTGFQASNFGDAIEIVNEMVLVSSQNLNFLLYSTEYMICFIFSLRVCMILMGPSLPFDDCS